jgi:hypothetical protein
MTPEGQSPVLVAATASGLYQLPVSSGAGQGEWRPLALEPEQGAVVALAASGAGFAAVTTTGAILLHGTDGFQHIGAVASGESLLQFLVRTEAAGPVILLVSGAPTPEGHLSANVRLWRSDGWTDLAGFTTSAAAVLAAWGVDGAILLATQHRLIRLQPDVAAGWRVGQHFFEEAARITALTADGPATWVATTKGVYRAEDGGEQWEQAGALPSGLPVVALAAEQGRIFALTLGGCGWLAELQGG